MGTFEQDLALAQSLYVQLGARVSPAQSAGGRRLAPASRPPIQVDMVSHMAAGEQYLDWWIKFARWLLDPMAKIDLTARTGARCPYDGGDLVAYLRPSADPDDGEIVCTNLDHPDADGPRRWRKADWPRLGVLAGVHVDARFGPRLHAVGDDA
jgi:hypothetical protein